MLDSFYTLSETEYTNVSTSEAAKAAILDGRPVRITDGAFILSLEDLLGVKVAIAAAANIELTLVRTSCLLTQEPCSNSIVKALERSCVMARDSGFIEARDSIVGAWDESTVIARGDCFIQALNNSSIEAHDISVVDAKGESQVDLWDQTTIIQRDSSTVRDFRSA
jgi:hypothetical protein